MNYVLFDDEFVDHLLPLTFTRPAGEIRVGILKIQEKWEKHLNSSCSHLTKKYLRDKYPLQTTDQNLFINSRILPNTDIVKEIGSLQPNEILFHNDEVIAFQLNNESADKIQTTDDFNTQDFLKDKNLSRKSANSSFISIKQPWDIFRNNGDAIDLDIELMSIAPKEGQIQFSNVIGSNLYMEEGASVNAANINTEEGPVFLGKNSKVMEGASIRGPFALCEGAQVKMNAKIYGPTTIGPYSKVGGEINNSVIFGYSNKAHDGFLGNSVIGEWCNLGADTNNSNLKNNYAEVKIWDYVKKGMINSNLQFCGLIMGDHSKCGINTMFNTGTVVGVSANIFGAGFPRNFIPSFSWGGSGGFITYQVEKALEVAEMVFSRRNKNLDQIERDILTKVFEITSGNRPK